MITREGYRSYIERIGTKVQKCMSRLVIPGQRNAEAVATHLAPAIIQSAKNQYVNTNGDVGGDTISQMYAYFSSMGMSDVSANATRGTEDITILAAVKSIAAYIAMDRSMDDESVSISYNQIVAVQDHSSSGLLEGDKVYDQFSEVPAGLSMNMSRVEKTATAGSANTISFGAKIVPNYVNITVQGDGENTYGKLLGKDDGKGNMSWTYEDTTAVEDATLVTIPTDVVISYNEGTVIFTASANTTTKVSATIDALADNTGSSILRVKGSSYLTAVLHAESENIVLESNSEAAAYRNKALMAQLEAGIAVDMAKQTFRQVLDMYVEYLNLRLVKAVISAGAYAISGQPSATYISEDITGVTTATTNPAVVGYKVKSFIEALNSQLLKACKHGITAIVTGFEGARILATVSKEYVDFQKAPTYDTDSDGFVGTANGIPVIRHHVIDASQTTKYADFYALYKDASGKVAPVAMGTYLPLYVTEKAGNFSNPIQYAQGLFSSLAIQSVVPQLVAVGRIQYAS